VREKAISRRDREKRLIVVFDRARDLSSFPLDSTFPGHVQKFVPSSVDAKTSVDARRFSRAAILTRIAREIARDRSINAINAV